jgi:anti-sigma factor RsiW
MLMPRTIHPTSRTLLAYLDGELPVEERSEIRAHVNDCSSCRDELDTMEADLDWFLVLEAASRTAEPPVYAGGLNRLLAATRAWQNAHPEVVAQAEVQREVENRAARALEAFFGPSVAAAMQSRDKTESVESLLATFLGKRAADALMTDIRRGNQPRLMASDLS